MAHVVSKTQEGISPHALGTRAGSFLQSLVPLRAQLLKTLEKKFPFAGKSPEIEEVPDTSLQLKNGVSNCKKTVNILTDRTNGQGR